MGEAAQRAAQAVAVVDVRAVRVADLVGEGMVLTVIGDPGGDRALDRRLPRIASVPRTTRLVLNARCVK